MNDCADLVARARGLSAHVLTPVQLSALCNGTGSEISAALVTLKVLPSEDGAARTPLQLELALRQRAARAFGLLMHWAGARAGLLSPLVDDEDLRSLRALVRRTVTGISPERRLDGLIATPNLPERALRLMAVAPDIATLASKLVTWRSAFGGAMAVEASRPHPDLFRMELELARVFALHATKASRHDRMMRLFTMRTIDTLNAWTALVIADQTSDIVTESLFLPGGKSVTLADIEFARTAGSRELLVARWQKRGAAAMTRRDPAAREASVLEEHLLGALLQEFRTLALREPTTLAPVILFVLQQRAELRALLRIVWSAALGLPPDRIRASLGIAA